MITEQEITDRALAEIAGKMLIAVRTAPKGRGADHLILSIAGRDDIARIAEKMQEIAERTGATFFKRDADNILQCPCMLIIGARVAPIGLPFCSLCGFADCDEKRKHPDTPCVFNITDLGIALGSAVSIAADHRVDNRIMYTAGMAVKELGMGGENASVVMCIPLSATSKSPFFDRK